MAFEIPMLLYSHRVTVMACLACAWSCAGPRAVETPERARAGTPVMLLPVETNAVVLLEEERRPIRDALLPWLQRRGHSVA